MGAKKISSDAANKGKTGRIPSVALDIRNDLGRIRSDIQFNIHVTKFTFNDLFRCYGNVYLASPQIYLKELPKKETIPNDREGHFPPVKKATFRVMDKMRADMSLQNGGTNWNAALFACTKVYYNHKLLLLNAAKALLGVE